MSMKITPLNTYWSAAQACDMLELLDNLRDQLWESYGEQIIAHRLHECSVTRVDDQQQHLDLGEEPF